MSHAKCSSKVQFGNRRRLHKQGHDLLAMPLRDRAMCVRLVAADSQSTPYLLLYRLNPPAIFRHFLTSHALAPDPVPMSQSTTQHRCDSPKSVRCAVITVSDTRTLETDRGGKLVAELLDGGRASGDGAARSCRTTRARDRAAVARLADPAAIDAILHHRRHGHRRPRSRRSKP